MIIRSYRAAAFVALVLAGSAGIALAPASAQARPMRVVYDDLDLRSPAGQQTLARRLNGAVDRVCPDNATTRFSAVACRREAMGRANADLRKAGMPTL